MWRNTETEYGQVAQLFHWVIGFGIIGMLILGNVMDDLSDAAKPLAYSTHKSIGMILWVLALGRLLWRFTSHAPASSQNLFLRLASNITHVLLYSLMIIAPLSGWLMSSAAGRPVFIFNWFEIPSLLAPDPKLRELFGGIHYGSMIGFYITLALHILGALFHHYILKDNTLVRMLPFKQKS